VTVGDISSMAGTASRLFRLWFMLYLSAEAEATAEERELLELADCAEELHSDMTGGHAARYFFCSVCFQNKGEAMARRKTVQVSKRKQKVSWKTRYMKGCPGLLTRMQVRLLAAGYPVVTKRELTIRAN
jgi:hypothetical protein